MHNFLRLLFRVHKQDQSHDGADDTGEDAQQQAEEEAAHFRLHTATTRACEAGRADFA